LAKRADVTFVDSNVIIDVLGRDSDWFDWSAAALTEAASNDAQISSIVVAELSRDYDSIASLRLELQSLDVSIVPLDDASAFEAGKRFQEFRRLRYASENARVLPDFLIGAHALMLQVPLLTRDPPLYRRYFPELTLITPESDNG
jgi:predicted nucleic acid-binding protein